MKTIYAVTTFWRDSRKRGVQPGATHHAKSEDEARQLGAALSKRAGGVVVLRVVGNPEADYWEEPEILARHGDAPREVA